MARGSDITVEITKIERSGTDWGIDFAIKGDLGTFDVRMFVPHGLPIERAVPEARAKLHRLFLELAKQTTA